MKTEITIVDRGRGLQLSTSRITVQDLVPYFQRGLSHDEIIRWIPTLTENELAVVERYYREHRQELDEQDRRIRERIARRLPPAEVENDLRTARKQRLEQAREMIRQGRRGRNGDNASG
jgi:uncharacterized protein (DUF433 family)